MDVRDNSSSSDGRFDERVEFLVSANRELQVTRRDTFHFQVFTGVAREFENFCGKVFEDGRGVDGSSRSDSLVRVNATLEESMNSSDRKLRRKSCE